jgi:predicted metal-dependent hydrolase
MAPRGASDSVVGRLSRASGTESGVPLRRASATADAAADAALARRADVLSRRYLGGHARPTSVRWVDGMEQRWGSCTVLEGRIRLSRRLLPMPTFVRDYVLLHELAHLLIAGHGPDFWTLLRSYPHVERARGFLAGVDHTLNEG